MELQIYQIKQNILMPLLYCHFSIMYLHSAYRVTGNFQVTIKSTDAVAIPIRNNNFQIAHLKEIHIGLQQLEPNFFHSYSWGTGSSTIISSHQQIRQI